MRKVLVIACLAYSCSASAELIEVKLSPGEVIEKRLTAAPAKFAELCSALRRGQAVAWQFVSEAATDFNIHYHVNKRTEYPEQRSAIDSARGMLIAEVDQTYCWMWTNRSDTAVVVRAALEVVRR